MTRAHVLVRLAALLALVFAGLTTRPSSAQQPAAAPAPPAFVVIANPSLKVKTISRAQLGKIFLRKATTWPGGGATVSPLDLPRASAAREAFSQKVHGKGAKAIKNWWAQQIYAGKGTPPPEVASEAKMLAAVLASPGAVGYVSGATATGDALVITITD